jgi:imidazolonepropionase
MITLVKNIRQLVTPLGSDPLSGRQMGSLAVREDVAMVIRGDRISSIEPTDKSTSADRVIDAAGGIVVPGLVDACVTAGRGPQLSPPALEEADLGRMRVGIEVLLRHGTTSAEIRAVATDGGDRVEGILAGLQQLTHHVPLRLTTAFLASPSPDAASERVDRITTLIGETIPSVSRRHLATTCVALCGEKGYSRKEARAVLRAARGAGLHLKVQACGADSEATLVAADLAAEAIDHLTGTPYDARPLALLKRAGTLPVLLPGLSIADSEPLPTARPLLDAGLAVALGSAADVGAGGVLSLWTGVAVAVRRLGLTLAEAITAATLNSAAALGVSHAVGTLEPGKLADFAILELDDHRRIPDFVVGLPIRTVVVGGREWGAR